MFQIVPILAGLLTAAAAYAQQDTEFFEKRIRPVLAEKCYSCHGPSSTPPMGALRVDTAELLRKGGDTGPAITPGDPGKSLLIKAIRYSDLRLKMPPAGKLSPDVIADFEKWIQSGAPDPRQSAPAAAAKKGIDWDEARKFWSFRPVAKPALPAVRNQAWVKSPVDQFLLSKLEAKNLTPAAPADRRTWLRRVTFDLTGLPPSPSEIQAYLADTSAEADRKVVERLLASPHYGERWARHWLDLVRFAETNGHEFDNEKLDAWRYRDYVIRAFNEDLPYDQFIRENIAGDLIPNKRLSRDGVHWESPIGTGIFWMWEVLNSTTDSVKSRADTVDNQIDVIGKAFLGLTVSCARCHDHKFDPIPTADYYSMAGVMHSTDMREVVIDSPQRVARIASLRQRIADINQQIRDLHRPAAMPALQTHSLRDGDILFEDFEDLGYEGWTVSGQAFGSSPAHDTAPNQPLQNYRREGMASSFGPGADRLQGALISRKFRMPKLWVHVRLAGTPGNKQAKEMGDIRLTVVADDHKSMHIVPSGRPGFEWKSLRMTKEIGRLCYIEIVDRGRSAHLAIDKIVFSDHKDPPWADEAPAGATAASSAAIAKLEAMRAAIEDQIPDSSWGMLSRDENPHNVHVHIRGNHTSLGNEVPRGFLKLAGGDRQGMIELGSGRLEMARWLASARNPLTPRVMVNRIWKHHFGTGLVRSTDNFGKMGDAPAQPELLDHLASEFIGNGWSVKSLHRMIVLSNAYRMSNKPGEEAMKTDPRNELLHHMPVRRLEAEALRDSILAVSGKLDRTLFGPSVMPHISEYQDGRGKPASGPLDGKGRRSIYIQVRRNFITPMFLVFDYPLPVSTIGTRGVSTVPSQALLMMNNEMVAQASKAWAQRIAAAHPEPADRIAALYEEAFARHPESWEREATLAFVARQEAALGGPGRSGQAWADLSHMLFNSAEFLYVR